MNPRALPNIVGLVFLTSACAAAPPPETGRITPAPATAPASAPASMISSEFEARMKEYVALQKKLEAELPKLPKDASPQQIEEHQVALEAKIRAARPNPKPGEFFTPPLQELVRKVLKLVLAGEDGKRIRSSIMDENPGMTKIALNERYPAKVPLSTMPPQVLEEMPKLEPDLEYRFIGRRLILLDTRADLILDYTEEVIPR
jgi:hypothetical protein